MTPIPDPIPLPARLDVLLEIRLYRTASKSYEVELQFDNLASQGQFPPVRGPAQFAPAALVKLRPRAQDYGKAFKKKPPTAILVACNHIRFEVKPTGHPRARWIPPTDVTINKAAIAPDAKSAWRALSNGDLCNVDIPTAKTLSCRIGGAPAEARATSKKGSRAVFDNTGKLKRDKDILAETLLAYSLAFSPDGQQLAAGLDEGKVRIFKNGQPEPADLTTGHDKPSTALTWSAGGLIAGCNENQVIRLWDATGKQLRDESHADGVIAIALSPDGGHVATIGPTGTRHVKVWPTAGGPPVLLTTHPSKARALGSVAFRGNSHNPDTLREAANQVLEQP